MTCGCSTILDHSVDHVILKSREHGVVLIWSRDGNDITVQKLGGSSKVIDRIPVASSAGGSRRAQSNMVYCLMMQYLKEME